MPETNPRPIGWYIHYRRLVGPEDVVEVQHINDADLTSRRVTGTCAGWGYTEWTHEQTLFAFVVKDPDGPRSQNGYTRKEKRRSSTSIQPTHPATLAPTASAQAFLDNSTSSTSGNLSQQANNTNRHRIKTTATSKSKMNPTGTSFRAPTVEDVVAARAMTAREFALSTLRRAHCQLAFCKKTGALSWAIMYRDPARAGYVETQCCDTCMHRIATAQDASHELH
ncbi:hypothetical protein F5Y05DRAFT_415215 [Hypoxylon sp. FL0543]|nr:hypothetical protein F5Y05DRAFT_415215 [Hypoxylon sp. FL0543]